MSATTSIPGNKLRYYPEDYGFTIVADIDGGSNWFDTVLVLRDPEGKLWAAHDQGCSCPSPFEDHLWPTDWTEIRDDSDLTPLLDQLGGEWCTPLNASELVDFKVKVRSAL